jgi:hypothetical protein
LLLSVDIAGGSSVMLPLWLPSPSHLVFSTIQSTNNSPIQYQMFICSKIQMFMSTSPLDVSWSSQRELLILPPKYVLSSFNLPNSAKQHQFFDLLKSKSLMVLFSPSFLAHSNSFLFPYKMHLKLNSSVCHLIHHPSLGHQHLHMNLSTNSCSLSLL